jgi:hypothetical protein
MIELTEPLLRALDAQQGQPLRLVDPRTNTAYLLVRADLFEQIQYADDEDEISGIDVGALINEVMREDDENDPLLEGYQKDRGPHDPPR